MPGQTSIRRVLTAAAVALACGVGALTLISGFSSQPGVRTLELVAVVVLGAAIMTGVIVLSLVRFGNWQSPASEDDFEAIVLRAERLAAEGLRGLPEDESGFLYEDFSDQIEPTLWNLVDEQRFNALVKAAIDELPLEFHVALEHVAIVIADGGAQVRTGPGRRGAYGLYQGDTVVQDHFHDRIVIFRDTLVRDFGRDPELLRSQVTRTVRHELAHHLGWNERGVSDLGL